MSIGSDFSSAFSFLSSLLFRELRRSLSSESSLLLLSELFTLFGDRSAVKIDRSDEESCFVGDGDLLREESLFSFSEWSSVSCFLPPCFDSPTLAMARASLSLTSVVSPNIGSFFGKLGRMLNFFVRSSFEVDLDSLNTLSLSSS